MLTAASIILRSCCLPLESPPVLLYSKNNGSGCRLKEKFPAEDEGFDLINVRLGLALAGGAHPRRI